IPSRSVNFEREYARNVLRYFFSEYRAGRTPNPDVRCNREIKFSRFFRAAKKMGCHVMATGHYAQTRDGRLYRGVDPVKDQSYFLSMLTPQQLRHTLFPIGAYRKNDVRRLAEQLGLPNARKKDSQGICFVGPVRVKQFLQERLRRRRGDIQDDSGRRIGGHDGAWYYTIGQREGLGLSGGPWYIYAKDVRGNVLYVVRGRTSPRLYADTAVVTGVNWIGGGITFPLSASVKIRTPGETVACRVEKNTRGYCVRFREPQFAVAAGQVAVFYRGKRVLGGGTIRQTHTLL
ncbi:MAG: tRNA 2-thiouridine(34) synthase MnmA, partial [Rhodospirillales bacterium]